MPNQRRTDSWLAWSLTIVLCLVPSTAFAAGSLYWIDQDEDAIYRANLDGTGTQVVASGEFWALDIDSLHSHIFWLESGGVAPQVLVRRANLDGSEAVTLLQLNFAQSIAVDPGRDTIFLGTSGIKGTGSLWRCNLDGSGLTVIVPQATPKDIAAGPDGRVYYARTDGIYRVNADGSALTELISIPVPTPTGIDIDGTAGKLYWAQGASTPNSELRQANLDGSGVTTLVVDDYIKFVSLDLEHGKVYWSQPFTANNIRRANLDGTDVETVLNGPRPWDLAVAPLVSVPVSSLWSTLGIVALMFLALTILIRGRDTARP